MVDSSLRDRNIVVVIGRFLVGICDTRLIVGHIIQITQLHEYPKRTYTMMQRILQRIWLILMVACMLALVVPVQGQEGDDPLEIFVSYTVLGVSEFKLDDGVYNVDVLVFLECSRACSDEEIAFDVMGVSGSEGVTIEDRARNESLSIGYGLYWHRISLI